MATAAMATQVDKSILVLLPSNRQILLPFKADQSSSASFDPKASRWVIGSGELAPYFAAVLRFPASREFDWFLESTRGSFGSRLDDGSVEIGMIDLFIHAGQRHVELSFTAVTSLMSTLFRESATIHRCFLQLIEEAGGVVGIIDVEDDDGDYLLLNNPERTIRLDRQTFLDDDFDPDRGGTDYDVDGFAAALLAGLESDRG